MGDLNSMLLIHSLSRKVVLAISMLCMHCPGKFYCHPWTKEPSLSLLINIFKNSMQVPLFFSVVMWPATIICMHGKVISKVFKYLKFKAIFTAIVSYTLITRFSYSNRNSTLSLRNKSNLQTHEHS